MFAFEVYGERDDLYVKHLASPAMQGFLAEVPAHSSTGLDLNHYSLVAGYLDKHGDKRECGIMLDARIATGSASARSALEPKLRKLATDINSTDQKGEVLTFMTFKSLDDDVNARIYARFADRDAMEKTIRTDAWTNFWLSTKEEITKMESRAYLPNNKGWLYRQKPAKL
jgi:quinol monooxygenase YgiN